MYSALLRAIFSFRLIMLVTLVICYRLTLVAKDILHGICRWYSRTMILSKDLNVPIVESDIWAYFHPIMKKYKERNAVICKKTGVIYTFNDVIMRSLRWANVLDEMFPDKSPTALIFSSNQADFPMIINGVFAVGGTVCTLNSNSPEELLAYIINDVKADVIVVENPQLELVERVKKSLGTTTPTFVLGAPQISSTNLHHIMGSSKIPKEVHRKVNPTAAAFIFFSSGTTGQPKGIVHTHKSYLTHCCVMSKEPLFQYQRKEGTQEYFPTSFTVAHMGGCVFYYGIPTMLGNCIVMIDYTDFSGLIAAIMKYKVERLILRPFAIRELANLENAENILSSLKCIFSGGTLLDTKAQVDLHKRIPHLRFMDGYGLTETHFITSTPGIGEVPVNGTCPVPGVRVHIRNPNTGEILGPMETGILMVKSPYIMKEYLNKPEVTKAAFVDGWMSTEDMAYITKNDRVIILGRGKDVIIVNGVAIFPAKIEQILCDHPSVLEAAVIGVPSLEEGQIPKAFVILKKNDVSKKDVENFANSRINNVFEKLRGVRFVNKMPRNAMGKILKKELRIIEWGEAH